MVVGFALENEWLSPFSDAAPVEYNGMSFYSVTQAYEYTKCANPEEAAEILKLKSYDSWKYGQKVERKPNWSEQKWQVLCDILWAKYRNIDLRARLMCLEEQMLIFTTANDACGAYGYYLFGKHESIYENNLFGKLTMLICAGVIRGEKPSGVTLDVINGAYMNMNCWESDAWEDWVNVHNRL